MSIPRLTELFEKFGKGRVILSASGSSAIIYTKTNPDKDWKSISITNDGSGELQIIINGLTITVKARETFDDTFEYFKTVQIVNDIAYRLVLRA